ncbi:WD40 repeat domain-containing protein [Nonomuraea sp. NPDC049269]|uniref:WD40 repeat domain-containing protein n=1 Tax=Nonomuraea sp. NPDC049269 TaxID=3364349 RepID=UPI003716B0D6
MHLRPRVTMTALLVLALVGACGDPAADRVSLKGETTAVPSLSGPSPSMPSGPIAPPSLTAALPSPRPMATSLAAPMATAAPLPATGSPRLFVTARTPLAYFPDRSKTAIMTPVRPAVHDATTGAFVATIPLPQGVRSSWHVVAAAPDNRTFVLAGWTGEDDEPFRFFRVRLADDGQPGDPIPVPKLEIEDAVAIDAAALSADATRLAYATALIGGGAKISILDLATGRRRDWSARAQSMVGGLAWAPDGRRLAWVGGMKIIGILDLARPESDLMAATSFVKQKEGLPLLDSVAYTPDGSALIYSAAHTIERVPVDGRQEPRVLARLTLPSDASLSLHFSLDGTGRYLMYVHQWRAFRVDLNDGSTTSVPITVKEHPGEGDPPRAAW